MNERKIHIELDCPWNYYCIDVKEDEATFQVHRVKGGINFEANQCALKTLSATAYKLYMSLIMYAENREWIFHPRRFQAQTALTESEIKTAFYELLQTNYIEPGKIAIAGGEHITNAFHVWEAPAKRKAT